jgi:nucleoside-diphosphate-sugar epimerase
MVSKSERIVLTGASGTLGRNFLDLVRHDESIEVLLLLRQGSRMPVLAGRVRCEYVDFSDLSTALPAMRAFSPTCVVHAAASGMVMPKPKWFSLIHFNVSVTVDICELVSKFPGCQFIYISTGLAYRNQGRPLAESDALDTLHAYGASKAAADILVRSAAAEFEVPLTVIRPFSFTGLWDDRTRLFPSLLRAAVENAPMKLSPCDQVRDHCSARDIAEGLIAAMRTGGGAKEFSRIYNLGSGSMTPLRQVIESVVSQLNLKVNLEFGARGYSNFEPACLVADIDAAEKDLGWAPRHNLAHAVWQLARESFPQLSLTKPTEFYPPRP